MNFILSTALTIFAVCLSGCRSVHPIAHTVAMSTDEMAFAVSNKEAKLIFRAIGISADHQKALDGLRVFPKHIRQYIVLELAFVGLGYSGDESYLDAHDDEDVVIRNLENDISARILIVYRDNDRLGYACNFVIYGFEDDDIHSDGPNPRFAFGSPRLDAWIQEEVRASSSDLAVFSGLLANASQTRRPGLLFGSNDASSVIIMSYVDGSTRHVIGGINCYAFLNDRKAPGDENSRLSDNIDILLKLWRRQIPDSGLHRRY